MNIEELELITTLPSKHAFEVFLLLRRIKYLKTVVSNNDCSKEDLKDVIHEDEFLKTLSTLYTVMNEEFYSWYSTR